MKFEVGQKIKFKSEKKRYTIVGITDRYLVCIKPLNFKKGFYLYTIVDLQEKMRGPDHWVFGKYNHKDKDSLEKCLEDLKSGECQLSHRRPIKLDLEES